MTETRLPTAKPAVRRRDSERTRTALLTAARTLFSTQGFANTGVRDIAALAGVNSSLVGRYFGSKQGLYRETLAQVLDIAPLLQIDRRQFGETVVSLFLGAHDASGPLAMLILSASDPEAHATSVELLQKQVIAPLARWLGAPDGEGRAARLNILWNGLLVSGRLLPIQRLSSGLDTTTQRWLAAAIQSVIDEGAA